MPKPLRAFATPVGNVIKNMYRTPCCNIEVSKKTAFKSTPLWPVKCPKCATKYHNGEARKLYLIAAVIVPIAIIAIVLFDVVYRTAVWKYALPLGLFGLLLVSLYEDKKITQKGSLTKTTRRDQIHFAIKLTLVLAATLILFVRDLKSIFS